MLRLFISLSKITVNPELVALREINKTLTIYYHFRFTLLKKVRNI